MRISTPTISGRTIYGRRHVVGITAGGGIATLLTGCASLERGPAVPKSGTLRASVLGLPNERFFPSHGPEGLDREFKAAVRRRLRFLGPEVAAKRPPDQVLQQGEFLAVSGGGEDGAFGAGLLCGWTETGTRPEFEVVTGVSTGALTAPFAFLGPAYDAQLRAVYTELKPADVLIERNIVSGVLGDAMADNSPLFGTISRFLNSDMLAAIAKGYEEGRLLLIGTTNLDARERVIWDIGAIAASNHPRGPDTIRRILLASAAVPGAFPPSMIEATLDGVTYQEMHVDGAAFTQAFLYPPSMTDERRDRLRRRLPVVPVTAYIIRNGRVDPGWTTVQRRTLGIAGRAISTMIGASGKNDLIRIYETCRRDNVDYKLAYIGTDFTMELSEPFDPVYMRALFDYGYQRARHGYDWKTTPPEF
jgi:hypothetical protein